jgi:hypothetical protein
MALIGVLYDLVGSGFYPMALGSGCFAIALAGPLDGGQSESLMVMIFDKLHEDYVYVAWIFKSLRLCGTYNTAD